MRLLSRSALVAAAVLSLTTAAIAPAVASASVTPLAQPHGRFGLKPIHPSGPAPAASGRLSVRSAASAGVVSPHPSVYLVFWGKQWSNDPAGAAPALQGFFTDLHGAADTYDTIFTQYCEGVPVGTVTCGAAGIHIHVPTSKSLKGVWFDNAANAPTHATQAQIAAEAAAAAVHFGNTTQAKNYAPQYVIVSPTGTHPDGFPGSGFCGWHDYAVTASGKIAYTNLPYVPDLGAGACTTLAPATLLDGLLSTETHEYAETLTDFWPSRGWNGALGEIGDACVDLDSRITLRSGTYDVQGEWSNAANACVTHG